MGVTEGLFRVYIGVLYRDSIGAIQGLYEGFYTGVM